MEGVGIVRKDFWRTKRVFLTGHTGFKGAWLALWLESLGAHVTGFSLDLPSQPNLFEVIHHNTSVKDLRGDVRDLAGVTHALTEASPDIVFHLAAQSLVRPSYDDPVATYATNVLGTVNLFEAVRKCASVRAVINVTSDKCYENRETSHAYTEHDRFGGNDPYSSSKGCAELVTAAYRHSFFSRPDSPGIASARAGNVIGGGDWSTDRLIPDCMRAVSAGQSIVIRNPASIRPWQHVLEALRGYLLLAEKLYGAPREYSEGFNFGPEATDAQPVSYIARAVCERWGEGATHHIESADAHTTPHEARLLRLDSSYAQKKLGWRPLLTLPQALDWTIPWYKAFYRGESMRDESIKQLELIQRLESKV
jgi:CDP-glucose 4,6-dehydratase